MCSIPLSLVSPKHSLEAELGAEGLQRERLLKECQGMPVGLGKQQVLKRGRGER